MEERALLAAAVLTLAGSFLKDAEIRGNEPDVNYGETSRLGANGSPDQASLFEWDLREIPQGSTIVSASFTIDVTDASAGTFDLYEVRRGWQESDVTFNTSTGTFAWGVPGADGPWDRNDTILGTVYAPQTGTMTVNLNAAGIAVVQDWVDNPGKNHGFLLKDYEDVKDRFGFRSSEDTTVSLRPTFTVNYTNGGTSATNQAPSVDAGPNRNITLSQSANLDGTVSDDGLPNPPAKVTTTWSKVSGPGNVTFANASAVDTTASFSTTGTYVLRLTASDGSLSASDTVTVTVSNNQNPSIPANFWITPAQLNALPTNGEAWNKLVAAAQSNAGTPNLSNQDDDSDVITLAKAIVGVRTNNANLIAQARANIMAAINTENGGRTLALGRNLVSYVVAANIVGLSSSDNATFKTWLSSVRNENLSGRTLISTHEDRPNNWGTHAGASRIAAALYLGDQTDLDKAVKVFKGWLGDRASYAGFSYGNLDWQADPSKPVGINPEGSTKQGHSIDGALPEEMRRGGSFTWPPNETGYPWEALQVAFFPAELLHNAGYDVYNWENKALLRAVQFLYDIGWPATGDDEWLTWIVNKRYGTNFQTFKDASPGKNMGWTAWTHQGAGLALESSQSPQPTEMPAEQMLFAVEQLTPFIEQARQFWSAGATDEEQALLNSVSFEIVDLPGNLLGQTVGNTVYIDVDAAGFGWFLDSTPADNQEFQDVAGEWVANSAGPAAGLVDLQSVLAHELGHILGQEHSDGNGLMNDSLAAGVRRTLDDTGHDEHPESHRFEFPALEGMSDLPIGFMDSLGTCSDRDEVFLALGRQQDLMLFEAPEEDA